MLKVVIADDERIIRDGISSIIPWEEHGFTLIGAAQNGLEAYDLITKTRPQIVITDLKMPGFDGLTLIAEVKKVHPEIIFVILSGYGEFELAKEAMRYGVKYYLLKPCNENKIIEVLYEIKHEIDTNKLKEENFIKKNREDLEKVMPLARDEFFRDLINNRNFNIEELNYYCELLNIRDRLMQIILFEPQGTYGTEELSGLSRLIDETFGDKLFFNSDISNQILVLIQPLDDAQIKLAFDHIKNTYLRKHQLKLIIACSDPVKVMELSLAYKEVRGYIKYVSITDKENTIKTRNKLVNTIIQYVKENLHNEELSLKWLSTHVIFMNESYLSKLFIKETGEKFSHYLMRIRMEKAKELINQSDNDLVYEVAQKVGFANNPQYFSQLFKRYTGYAPSEYIKTSDKVETH